MRALLLVVLMFPRVSLADENTRTKWLPVVMSASEHYGLDWKLLDAIIQVESGWNEQYKTETGVGIAQLNPSMVSKLKVRKPLDPGQNIWGAALYLKQLNVRLCNWRLVLAAYNSGRHDRRTYIDQVTRMWDSIEAQMISSCRRKQ